MSRSALRLAALASSAVPGLDPVSVEGAPVQLGDPYEFAFVTDSQDRRWVVKAARTAAAGALLEDVSSLTALLAPRLEVAVPIVRGVAALKAGRAVVHPRVPGQAVDFAALPPGATLTAEVGRTLAQIHNLQLLVFEEAGRPSYDAETHRKRMLSELDRASSTGHVPAGLLARWEHRLEDISLWRFAPTPVHGAFTGSHVLAGFDDDEDAGSGRVCGVIGWEEARLGDPADDLAELVARASRAALDTVLEAYVQTRIERPDGNLVRRARLAAEMSLVHALLRALSAGETELVEHLSAQLRELDEWVQEAERRAEARRRRAEEAARRERELAQAAAAAAAASSQTPGREDGGGQPLPRPGGASADEATQPFAGPAPSTSEQLTQPFSGAAFGAADQLTQRFEPFPQRPVDADPGRADYGAPERRPERGSDEAADPGAPARQPETGTDEVGKPAHERSWQLGTAVDPESLFEIDSVEPLPEEPAAEPTDGEAFDDRHEGASDFVPVEPHHPQPSSEDEGSTRS
ncbi:MAG TPA: phosphotransferase [Intrasporangium sp.]|nr:phosphotransferase [Intrasporangium sp.]